MITIIQVAKEAGVSVATVSRVLHDSPLVTEKTKIIVKKIIDELKYEPNMLGRNLRFSETRIILTLLSNIANPFFSEIVHGVHHIATKNNYNVLVCERDKITKGSGDYFDLLKQKLVDGMIVLDPAMEPAVDLEKLQDIAERYPVVQCCEYYPDVKAPYVSIDNLVASKEAVHYLVSIGCRKIGLVNYNEKLIFSRLRKQGYLEILSEYNLDYRETYVVESGLTFENGQKAADYFLSLENKPDALFVVADLFAIGMLKVFKEKGLRVPQDIKIIGFDNINFSEWCNPSLTTVSQPTFEIGCKAAEVLIDRINKKSKIASVILDHELILRESTSI